LRKVTEQTKQKKTKKKTNKMVPLIRKWFSSAVDSWSQLRQRYSAKKTGPLALLGRTIISLGWAEKTGTPAPLGRPMAIKKIVN